MRPVYPDGSYEGTVRPKQDDRYVSSKVTETRPDWHADAACAGVNPDVFFPDFGQPGRPSQNSARKDSRSHPLWVEALRVCARCPVKADCLADAMGERSSLLHGVWGGTIPAERVRMPMRGGCAVCGAVMVQARRPNGGHPRWYCGAEACEAESRRRRNERYRGAS